MRESPMRIEGSWLAIAALTVIAGPALATYSPPLTRVRIDADRVTHTPELVLAFDRRDEGIYRADAQVLGGQYILQLESARGLGLQVGAALGRAAVDVSLQGRPVSEDGRSALFAGGQLRAYAMVWSHPYAGRAHALTAFVNLRLAHYSTPDGTLASTALGAGVGAMAELVLNEYVSLCPYAWLTPGLYSSYAFEASDQGVVPGPERVTGKAGPGLRTPLQFGLDVWIYVLGARSDQHLSLSVIASLVDTSVNASRAVSGVVGWTF